MISLLRLIIVFIYIFSFQVMAAEPSQKKAALKKTQPSKRESVKNNKLPAPESRSQIMDILAIPTGALLGFGIGHTLQSRYLKTGWIYTLVDVVTLTFAVPVVMGDCAPDSRTCKSNQNNFGSIATALFFGSRIAQIIDLSYFYYEQTYASQTPKHSLFFAIIPTNDGALQPQLAWTF